MAAQLPPQRTRIVYNSPRSYERPPIARCCCDCRRHRAFLFRVTACASQGTCHAYTFNHRQRRTAGSQHHRAQCNSAVQAQQQRSARGPDSCCRSGIQWFWLQRKKHLPRARMEKCPGWHTKLCVDGPRSGRAHRQWLVALLLALGLGAQALVAMSFSRQSLYTLQPAAAQTLEPNTELVAFALFHPYMLAFEVASILLLVAMIGAVVMAKKKV